MRYINDISRLVSALRQRIREINHCDRQLRLAEAKVLTQSRTLCALHLQARTRNEQIAHLHKKLQGTDGVETKINRTREWRGH